MPQSASVSLLAVCSGMVLPVDIHVPALVAVYAMPMGPAQLVNSAIDSMTSIFIITSNIAQSQPQVKPGPVYWLAQS